IAIALGKAGLEPAKQLLASYPANCPPTVLVVDAEADHVERAIVAMQGSLACQVEKAVEGFALTPGRVYLAFEKERHTIIEAGDPPRLRMVSRDPVAGVRPSADLLLGSIARAGIPAIGGLLVGNGADGAKGLQILSAAGYLIFVQTPANHAPRERFEAVRSLGLDADEVTVDMLGPWVLDRTLAES
ncbi:MAG: chemotaxis protein CheB, partial [Erythrobacter sp.]